MEPIDTHFIMTILLKTLKTQTKKIKHESKKSVAYYVVSSKGFQIIK